MDVLGSVIAVVQQRPAEERCVCGRGRRGRNLHVQEVRARLTPNQPHPQHMRGRSVLKSLCVVIFLFCSLLLKCSRRRWYKCTQQSAVGRLAKLLNCSQKRGHLVFADGVTQTLLNSTSPQHPPQPDDVRCAYANGNAAGTSRRCCAGRGWWWSHHPWSSPSCRSTALAPRRTTSPCAPSPASGSSLTSPRTAAGPAGAASSAPCRPPPRVIVARPRPLVRWVCLRRTTDG